MNGSAWSWPHREVLSASHHLTRAGEGLLGFTTCFYPLPFTSLHTRSTVPTPRHGLAMGMTLVNTSMTLIWIRVNGSPPLVGFPSFSSMEITRTSHHHTPVSCHWLRSQGVALLPNSFVTECTMMPRDHLAKHTVADD